MLGFMLLLVEATVQVVRIETALIRAVVLPTFPAAHQSLPATDITW